MLAIGSVTPAGPLLVEKLSDVAWAVRTPEGDYTGVGEDPEGPGYLGERWAVAAVLEAEQAADVAAGEYDPVTGWGGGYCDARR